MNKLTEIQKIIGLLVVGGLDEKETQDICFRLETIDNNVKIDKEIIEELKTALSNLLKSDVIRTAPYISYSEAYLNAEQVLARIKSENK